MTKIRGIISAGGGYAINTTPLQRPHFEKQGLPDLDRLKDGTINLDISPSRFEIIDFDYECKDIFWCPDDPSFSENFGFIKIY